MPISRAEKLTTLFYQWEQRGRGWNVYDIPVDLEPTFAPFFYYLPQSEYIDDGIRPTIASSIIDFIKGSYTLKPQQEEFEGIDYTDIDPIPFYCNEDYKIFQISLPKEQKIKQEETDQLLLMLSNSRWPISFEIIAKQSTIFIQFVCRDSDVGLLENQLKAYFPTCILIDRTDELFELTYDEDKQIAIADFGLAEEFMRQFRVSEEFSLDPFSGLFAVMENLRKGEIGMIQVLFKGAVNSWSESIIHSVTDGDGKSFFADAPEMVQLAKDKISSPFYCATIRAIGLSDTVYRASQILESIGTAVMTISNSPFNRLIPLLNDDYEFQDRLYDVLRRESHRSGMILNTSELATFVHLPNASVISSKLLRDTKKTKEAPLIAKGNSFVIGAGIIEGKPSLISLDNSLRLKHTHVIGATGTGKSTFLLSCIVQDIEQGQGIAVLDPHGDLIENILSHIPANRYDDVVLIDPADSEFPVGFNILSAHSEVEKEILSSDLVSVFRRLSSSWGDQMNSVLANAIIAFLESNQGGTLIDLRRFLIEKSFRDSFLKTISDQNTIYYWQKEYPLLKTSSIGSILTRLDTFLRPKLIRYMVAQKKSLDFEQILDSKKILLVKLSQGLIGNENSYLLGTVIVSKIHQAAMARQAKSKAARGDFFVYIDEFQNFITPSMASILSGARKYHLGLILAHQDMQQLVKEDSELASSIISNAGTRICFRLGDIDAKRLESGFSFFEAQDLQKLNTGEAISRIERPDFDFTLSTYPLTELELNTAEGNRQKIIELSRQKYGTPKVEVEALYQTQTTIITEPGEKEKQVEYSIPEPTTKTVPIKPIPLTQKEESIIKESLIEKETITRHRYLQTLIKKMAESRGYVASIEQPTPDGKGRVDVSLERNGKKIAVEICVTTPKEWELQNIQKCISAGYEVVVECSSDLKVLEQIREKVRETIDPEFLSKIFFFEPDEFFQYLDLEITKEASTETRIKGYRVKVNYIPPTTSIAGKNREQVVKTVADSLRKKKK